MARAMVSGVASSIADGLYRASRADWLTSRRVIVWSGFLLTFEVLLFGVLVLWQHGLLVPIERPTSSDFVSFYAAGQLALAGTPALAYDQAAHEAAEAAATMPGLQYQFFFYPPVYMLWCAPLALLPYMTSFVVLQAVTLGAWLLVMRQILQVGHWLWCIPALAYPAVFWTLGLGQNAFLTASLFGGSTLLLDKRPVMAGVLLGMLCYKPHLAVLAPIVLAVTGRWRVLGAAAMTVAAVVALSVVVFGRATWWDYLAAIAGSSAVYESGRINLAGFVTPYGAVRVLGASAGAARLAQGLASILVVITVGWIWRCGRSQAARLAGLAAGALLSVPLALVYDLMLLTVAMAWLVRAGRSSGFLPWEKLTLFWCFLVPLLSCHLGQSMKIPIGPLGPAGVLALCVVRTLRAAPVIRLQPQARPGALTQT